MNCNTLCVASKRLSDKATDLNIQAVETYCNFNGKEDEEVKAFCVKLTEQAETLHGRVIYQDM